MTYYVLARKWRPKQFSEVVGQDHILKVIKNSLISKKIHHSFLLSGTRGVGKTTIARLFSKCLNCKINYITEKPCGNCNNCIEIDQGKCIDLMEIDAASRTKVEDIREILDGIQYAPVQSRFKIYIIDEVHMLSRYSFNALLKILEEPPSYIKFILATTDLHKLPITIISRCIQFHLKALNIKQIYNRLSFILDKENISSEPLALKQLSKLANGSMRDALSLTDQAISACNGNINIKTVNEMLGILDIEYSLKILEAILDFNINEIFIQIEKCNNNFINWESLIIDMLFLLKEMTLSKFIQEKSYIENSKLKLRLYELTKKASFDELQLYYQILIVGRKDLAFAPSPKIGIEMTLLRILTFHPLNKKNAFY